MAGFERIDSNFERNPAVGKTASHATEKSLMKGRVNRCGKLYCCKILRNCPSHPSLQPPPPYQHHQHRGRTLHQQNDYNLLKAQMMAMCLAIFLNERGAPTLEEAAKEVAGPRCLQFGFGDCPLHEPLFGDARMATYHPPGGLWGDPGEGHLSLEVQRTEISLYIQASQKMGCKNPSLCSNWM
ncbi:LOW QUALITY PROTEIN: hypothetical protein QTO34_004339 [Cnephaeus nilssonii]|uniref:Uncharacterized protein n=1 Tax=Cnephaeus nilssonii TaxID=3371016 RepID=A0AA40LJN5_CNENI|nr:LOW QUALITY PROTEIN: hypothetical protein QTO34_004339 [Eptesicus nilssonii]